MPLALVSDIHGNLAALEAVVSDIRARGITDVVNLGDHVSGPLWPRETADRLLDLGWPSIAGNHDRQLLGEPATLIASDACARDVLTPSHLEWLRSLPSTMRRDDGGRMLIVHGTPSSDLVYLLETVEGGRLRLATHAEIGERLGHVDAELVACGHSHVPRLVRLSPGLTVVNPGSVGLQAYEGHTPARHASETGSPHARYAIVDTNGARRQVTFVALEYDWEAASARAAENGRDDWAYPLETGFAPRARVKGTGLSQN